MANKRYTLKQIAAKLRRVGVLISRGSSVANAVRQISVIEVILVESGRQHYNAVRPHASRGHRPPAPEVRSSTRRVAGGAS